MLQLRDQLSLLLQRILEEFSELVSGYSTQAFTRAVSMEDGDKGGGLRGQWGAELRSGSRDNALFRSSIARESHGMGW